MIFINSICTLCGNILNIDQFRVPIQISQNNSIVVVNVTLENYQDNIILFEANDVANVTIYGELRITRDNSTKQFFTIQLLNSFNNDVFSGLKVFFNGQEIIDTYTTNEINMKYENNARTPQNTIEQLVSRKVIFAQVFENRTYFTNDSTQQCNPNNYSSMARKLTGCLLSQFNLDGSCVSSCTTSKPYISVDLLTCSSACAPSNKILVISPSEIRCLSECHQNYRLVSQSVYSNYQQCVNDYNISNIDDYCDWIENSRVWNVSRMCNKNSQLQLSWWFNHQLQQEGSQDINMEVVNVLGLGQNTSVFSLLNLKLGSSLKNAHFIVACTIDMAQPQNSVLQKLFISLFDQVFGNVQNVFVSGRIDIVNLNPAVTNSLVLSRMFGNVLVPLSQRSGGQSIFINVSSNLQYFLNGVEITTDNQTVSGLAGVSIRYINSFEEAMTAIELGQSPSLYLMNVGVPTYSIQQMVANQQLYLTQVTVIDRADTLINLKIYTKFDPAIQQNAFKDYYLNAHLRLEEQKFQITNMAKYTFGVQYTVIDNLTPRQNIRFVVFTSETKAVLLKDNSFMIFCDNRQLLDTVSLTCITRASCTGYILNATCLRQCPQDHWFVTIGTENLCFLKCPIHLNYYNTSNLNGVIDPRVSQCIFCSGKIAREGDCKNNCLAAQSMFTFMQGCYTACQIGTIQTANSCSSPSTISQCANNYIKLSDYSASQYYDICSNIVSSNMFIQNSSLRTVLWTCSGKVTISRVCDANSVQCSQKSGLSATPVTNISGSLQLCQLSCISGYLNSSNECTNTCPDLYYSQKITGNCLQCQTNEYDNGQFWDRATQKCVISCQYINQTQPAKACELVTDLINCPFKSELSQSNQFECLAICPINRFLQLDNCRKSCYLLISMYVQIDNRTCASTCTAGQLIIVSYPLNVFCVVSCPANYIIISQTIYGTYQQCVPVADCTYYLNLQAKICSTSSCSETSGFYEVDGSSNKICNPCDGTQGGVSMKYKTGLVCSSAPCAFYTNLAAFACSSSCSETSGFYEVDGSSNKICNPCDGTQGGVSMKYKTGLICSSAPCTFYTNLAAFACSSSCSETSGFYEVDGSSNKICNPCDGTQGGVSMKYKTGLICSSAPCTFYTNLAAFACSSSCSETSGFYEVDGSSNKICNPCDGTQGGVSMKYKTGLICSSAPCTFYTNLAAFTCSSSCSETSGFYEVDGSSNKICNPCDGTQGGVSMKYKTGLICSSAPCTFYTNLAAFACSSSCSETSGFYEVDGSSNKICNPCDGTQGGVSMKYKTGLVCSSAPCTFYTNLAAFACSSSCSETSGFYEVDGSSNKICNPCDGTQGGVSMKYKTGLVCSSAPCAFYTNLAAFTCSSSCSETSGFYEVDGSSNKICNPCDGTQGGVSMKYKTGLFVLLLRALSIRTWLFRLFFFLLRNVWVLRSGRVQQQDLQSVRRNPRRSFDEVQTGLICSSARALSIRTWLLCCSFLARNVGFYEVDGSSNKICNPCDGTQGGVSMKYKTGLICSSAPCAFYTNLAAFTCSSSCRNVWVLRSGRVQQQDLQSVRRNPRRSFDEVKPD
ncbi:Conserved_hypothetical protein [Hexamita inflata]|uniref:Uncharacterized protein n=1 Tax=Hexamita inflata TaxID=28002 RepID=A0AA86PN68_9EUKA|nr:Conserved hypothetical protein [Hexamita inflata]